MLYNILYSLYTCNDKIISPAPPRKCSIFLKRLQVPITYMDQIYPLFKNEKALDVDKTT